MSPIPWVSCAERMPDGGTAGKSYLVYAESADPSLPLYFVACYFPDDPARWFPLPAAWSGEVSHWAPLTPPS